MNVGDVLFLYAKIQEKNVILPVRICEKTLKQSITETTETYSVEVPGNDEYVQLSQLDQLGKVFSTLDEAKESLIANATTKINSLIAQAQTYQNNYYGTPPTNNDQTEIVIMHPEDVLESTNS